jgi:hypothetical protein
MNELMLRLIREEQEAIAGPCPCGEYPIPSWVLSAMERYAIALLVESDRVNAGAQNAAENMGGRSSCKVLMYGKTDPPQDCDWPFCGCDPHATKVIEALQEMGWGATNELFECIARLNRLSNPFIVTNHSDLQSARIEAQKLLKGARCPK